MNKLIEKLVMLCECRPDEPLHRSGCKHGEILIGDVLEKMTRSQADDLLEYWSVCGFTRSLQEIGGELKNLCAFHEEMGMDKCACHPRLKPEAKALEDFLTEILL